MGGGGKGPYRNPSIRSQKNGFDDLSKWYTLE